MIRRSVETLDGRTVARLITGPDDEVRAALAEEGFAVGPVQGFTAPIARGGVRVGRLAVADNGSEARLALSLDWGDPIALASWGADLRAQIADVIAAGLDATAPPADRVLGRKVARGQIEEAAEALAALFSFAGLSDVQAPLAGVAAHRNGKPDDVPHQGDDEHAVDLRTVEKAGRASLVFASARDRRWAVEEMDLVGLLFLAMVGSRGERAEVDPPLVQALASLRETVEGWIGAPSGRIDRASIAGADLDLFVRRLDATIEIARRAGMQGAP